MAAMTTAAFVLASVRMCGALSHSAFQLGPMPNSLPGPTYGAPYPAPYGGDNLFGGSTPTPRTWGGDNPRLVGGGSYTGKQPDNLYKGAWSGPNYLDGSESKFPVPYGGHNTYAGSHHVAQPWGATFDGPTQISDGSDVHFGYGAITSRPPYGRWSGIHPGPGHDVEPMYYDPRDPFSIHPNTTLMNFSDPYRNAAYLPRTQGRDPSAANPGFGYIPANQVHPDEHPFHFGGRFFRPDHNTSTFPNMPSGGKGHWSHGFKSLIPFQVPIPGYHNGNNHPLYATWYEPGVAPGENKFAFPKPIQSLKARRPRWFDTPQSWPQSDHDQYASFIIAKKPPGPPPEAPEAAFF